MGLLNVWRGRGRASGIARVPARERARDTAHLEAWALRHRGVEAYVEPETVVTETTVVLVAHDGEWTRRRVTGPRAAYTLGRKLGIPVYDVSLVGYPRRMREYTARRSLEEKRGLR